MKDSFNFKNFIKKPAFKILILSIIWVMVIVPLLGQFHLISKTMRISIIFLVVNNIISLIIGRVVKLKSLNKNIIYIFPIVFMIQVIFRYGSYGFYFGIIYLLVSLLTYILTKLR